MLHSVGESGCDFPTQIVSHHIPARQPGPPSQQVSQIVWQREHCNLARISIIGPPQTGQAGRVGLGLDFVVSSVMNILKIGGKRNYL